MVTWHIFLYVECPLFTLQPSFPKVESHITQALLSPCSTTYSLVSPQLLCHACLFFFFFLDRGRVVWGVPYLENPENLVLTFLTYCVVTGQNMGTQHTVHQRHLLSSYFFLPLYLYHLTKMGSTNFPSLKESL